MKTPIRLKISLDKIDKAEIKVIEGNYRYPELMLQFFERKRERLLW